MPAGKFYRAPRPKRVQKVEIVKKRPRRSVYGKISRMPFKNHTIVTMKYSQFISVTTASGVYNETAFRMNSIFDPDFTGGGHQPYGYDAYATFYNKYRVLKMKYKIVGQLSSAAVSVLTVLPNNNTTASAGNAELAAESTYGKFGLLSGVGAEPVTIKGSIDLARFNGRTKQAYHADDLFEAIYNQSPSEIMTLHVGIGGATATTTTLLGIVEIWYTVELFDPLQLAQS